MKFGKKQVEVIYNILWRGLRSATIEEKAIIQEILTLIEKK